MKFNNLGDWCKWLEKNFSPEVMIPTLPVIVRLDGENFSKWTRGLKKPFDDRLTDTMIATVKDLVKETNAIIGYHQSDEITLILWSNEKDSGIYHDGKKQKIISKLAGKCANFFNKHRRQYLPEHDIDATFDCRVYQTPTREDAASQLLWRENDATRNSKQMLGQAHFTHKQLQGKNTDEIQDMLMNEYGTNWNNVEIRHKRGTYVRRETYERNFTAEEIRKLPQHHEAKNNPDMLITRSSINIVDMPIFNKITNRAGVIFFKETPKLRNNEI